MESRRQLVHISMIGFAFLLRWLSLPAAMALGLAALGFNLFVMPLIGGSLFRETDREGRGKVLGAAALALCSIFIVAALPHRWDLAFRIKAGAAGALLLAAVWIAAWNAFYERRGVSTGMIAYCLSVLLLLALFPMPTAAAAWAVMSLGDGFATLVGKRLPVGRIPWNGKKSWGGFWAFVLFGFAGAAVLYKWTSGGEIADPARVVFVFLFCAVVAALVESAASGFDDNFSVPLTFGTLAHILLTADRLTGTAYHLLAALVLNGLLFVLIRKKQALDEGGMTAALLVGTATVYYGGVRAFAPLLAFFIAGVAATKFQRARKEKKGLADEAGRGGRRGARNVWANGAVGTACAFLAGAAPANAALFKIALTGAYAAAAADTVSSELGKIFGRNPRLITTWTRVEPGENGGVTLMGTLLGVGAALMVGLVASLAGFIPASSIWLVAVAGALGNLADSLLGDIFERRGLIDNEWVNVFCTLTGAVAAHQAAVFLF